MEHLTPRTYRKWKRWNGFIL